MKLRLGMSEVVRIICGEAHAFLTGTTCSISNPRWLKDHGPHDGGVGEAYDVPEFLEFDVDIFPDGETAQRGR
jgi:hypothetical protein